MTTEAQTEVLTPEVVKSEALTMPQRAQVISKITTHDEYAQAGSLLVQIKTMRKRIADVFGPIVQAAFAAHKVAKGKQTEAEAPLDLAEGHLKRLICNYNEEQDRIRQEQQRQAEAMRRKRRATRKKPRPSLSSRFRPPWWWSNPPRRSWKASHSAITGRSRSRTRRPSRVNT